MSEVLETDRANVLRCIRAIVEGPFIPDWEFSTVMGFTRDEMAGWLATDPQAFDETGLWMAIAAMNNLSGYPHKMNEKVFEMTGLNRQDVRPLLVRFRRANNMGPGESYIDNLV